MSRIAQRRDELNRSAKFFPKGLPNDELPMLRVAGVDVFVYIDRDGSVRVSVQTDAVDTAEFPEWADGVPVRVDVGDDTVFDAAIDDECITFPITH